MNFPVNKSRNIRKHLTRKYPSIHPFMPNDPFQLANTYILRYGCKLCVLYDILCQDLRQGHFQLCYHGGVVTVDIFLSLAEKFHHPLSVHQNIHSRRNIPLQQQLASIFISYCGIPWSRNIEAETEEEQEKRPHTKKKNFTLGWVEKGTHTHYTYVLWIFSINVDIMWLLWDTYDTQFNL